MVVVVWEISWVLSIVILSTVVPFLSASQAIISYFSNYLDFCSGLESWKGLELILVG